MLRGESASEREGALFCQSRAASASGAARAPVSARRVLDIVKVHAFEPLASVEEIALQGKADARKGDLVPGNLLPR